MRRLTRKEFLTWLGCSAAGALLSGQAACRHREQALGTLVIQAPPSPPSLALLRVARQGVPPALAAGVRFQLWSTADEMRARVTSGQAHLSGLPVNVAATLWNRGLKVQLLNVYIWGILYLVTRDPDVSSWQDLRGEKVLIPFRGDLPDILTQYLLRKQGLDLASDLEPGYLSAAPEAAQLLAAGQASHAVLSEPSATLAILKARENGVSLRRALDYSQAWAEATGRAPRIPMAGVVAGAALVHDHAELLPWFQQAHQDAASWVATHTKEASLLGAEEIKAIPAVAMEESLPYIRFEFAEAGQVRDEIDFFLSEMRSLAPELIGGDLPADEFYHRG